jgi:uncharacterized lipoprotein YbaY
VVLVIEVETEEGPRPPAGAAVIVQVRDTSRADTEAPLVAEGRAQVSGERSSSLATVELEIPGAAIDPRVRLTVFAHVDVDGDGALSAGDFITTRSYPLDLASGDEGRMQVVAVRI